MNLLVVFSFNLKFIGICLPRSLNYDSDSVHKRNLSLPPVAFILFGVQIETGSIQICGPFNC